MTIHPLACWAKLSRSKEQTGYHPLLYHLIDVAVVTETLWNEVLPAAARQRVAEDLGVDSDTAGCWIAFLAGIHDLGKASPVFQGLNQAAQQRLERSGLTFSGMSKARHGTISTWALRTMLHDQFGVPRHVAGRLATVIGGHHGVFPGSQDVGNVNLYDVGGHAWDQVRLELAVTLATTLGPLQAAPTTLGNASALWLAGFISVADWIGSDDTYFPYGVTDATGLPGANPAGYRREATEQAKRAVRELGWSALPRVPSVKGFTELFQVKPIPVQDAVITLAAQLSGPSLVIVEAPMGEGKTEAALYLADQWSVTTGNAGCYVALPTQATSNQMFGRVRDYLAKRYDASLVNLQLLHGHAALSAEFEALKLARHDLPRPAGVCGDEGYDGAPAAVIAAEWFTYRKRGLLAPFGVGTIDQVLLAALQTRHFFVRLFGLTGKTIIIDEVHAYDAYMSTLLERLLEWLGALGCRVVLLSATLPNERRTALATAFGRGIGTPASGTFTAPYPRLTWVSQESAGDRTVAASELGEKTVRVRWLADAADDQTADQALAEQLKSVLVDGGCVAVICTTVRRAQEVYTRLASDPYFTQNGGDGQPVLDLLHARYLYMNREQREQRALVRFGKPGATVGAGAEVKRPHRAVLVATQVIEQSLDLDFDLLVTDLAPVDLVLQRIGRLHRHRRRDADRPAKLREATVWLRPVPLDAALLPVFPKAMRYVYAEHILLRSWRALRPLDERTLVIPEHVGDLIEGVYGEQECPDGPDTPLWRLWQKTREKLIAQRQKDESKAQGIRILGPNYEDEILEDLNRQLEEENPDVHETLQALTRLGERTIPVVCFAQDRSGDAQTTSRVPPGLAQARDFLRRSVAISDRRVIGSLLALPIPPGWERSPLLRHHRRLDLDSAGGVTLGAYRLQLDPALGIQVVATQATGATSDAEL